MQEKFRIIESVNDGYEMQKLEYIGNQSAPVWKRIVWGTLCVCELQLEQEISHVKQRRNFKVIKEIEV